MLHLFDETGVNPLPPGISVSVYSAGGVGAQNLVGSNVVLLGGFCDITLSATTPYIASFAGTQAPTVTAPFTTNSNGGSVITVTGYQSPTRSQIGWANEQASMWPRGRFSAQAQKLGGNAYAIASAVGAGGTFLDIWAQAILASMRLKSSPGAAFYENLSYFNLTSSCADPQGAEDSGFGVFDQQLVSDAVDSWAADFFGSIFTRCANASDAQWIAEINTILTTPKCTLAGMAAIIAAALPCINQEITVPGGLAMGADTYGGADEPLNSNTTFADAPVNAAGAYFVLFDAQSNPTLAAEITPNIVPTQFCVYLRNPNEPDSNIAPHTISSPTLQNIINYCKPLGIAAIYARNF